MRKHIYNWIWCLVVPVLATSCIKEDLDDCKNVTVYFQYLADGDTDVLHQYMTKVDLYVFDEGGHIMGKGSYNEDELKNFAAVPSFRLNPGRYKVVAVGNPYDKTEVVNVRATSFDEIYIQHPDWDGDKSVDGHDHNYVGQKVFEVKDGGSTHEVVTLESAHMNVDISVTGLHGNTGRDGNPPYRIEIEGSNAQITFNNEINVAEKGTCYPELFYDAEKDIWETRDLALFRVDSHEDNTVHDDCCEHVVKLYDNTTDELLAAVDLSEFLKRHKEIDLTKEETLLPLEFEFTEVGVKVKVPDWYIEDTEPGWD